MTPKVVLFDLDGTLVRAGGAGRAALNRAVKRLHGAHEVCSEFSLAGRTDKDNFRLAFRAACGRLPTAVEVAAIESAYLRCLPAEMRKAVKLGRYELVAGIEALLARLKGRRDCLVGLGTGNVEHGARLKLEPSGLLDHFDFGGFGNDGYRRVAVLRAAVKRAEQIVRRRIPPRSVYVIGDTDRDVLAAKEAGYRSGVVTAGFGELATIRRARPDLLAKDFSDLKRWLAWLGVR